MPDSRRQTGLKVLGDLFTDSDGLLTGPRLSVIYAVELFDKYVGRIDEAGMVSWPPGNNPTHEVHAADVPRYLSEGRELNPNFTAKVIYDLGVMTTARRLGVDLNG